MYLLGWTLFFIFTAENGEEQLKTPCCSFEKQLPLFSHLCSEVSRKHGEEKMFLNNHSIEKIRKDHEKSGNVSEDQEMQKKIKSQFDLVFPFYLKSNAHSNAHPGHPWQCLSSWGRVQNINQVYEAHFLTQETQIFRLKCKNIEDLVLSHAADFAFVLSHLHS